MNERYRKQMRLKSRHYRQGHHQFCKCFELWQKVGLAIKKYLDSGKPMPVLRVRMRTSEPASPHAEESIPASLPRP